MAISKPRNRVVLFRLTQDEYQQVQAACVEGGARSVSDFARARILGAAPGSTSLAQVEAKLAELAAAVERLTMRMTETSSSDSSGRAEAVGAGYSSGTYAKSGD